MRGIDPGVKKKKKRQGGTFSLEHLIKKKIVNYNTNKLQRKECMMYLFHESAVSFFHLSLCKEFV